MRSPLPPLPAHPPGACWPTQEWRPGSIDDGEVSAHVDQAADALFATPEQNPCGRTDALLVVNGSELVLERYRDGHSSADTFHSWSMAKSITHALVGILVHDGRVDPGASPVAPAWRDEGDPRSRITLEDLLRMVDGLAFVEADYEARRFDVVEMIQGAGESDTAAWAQALPLACPPGGALVLLERALARLVSCFPVDRECARRRRIATTGDRP